jgi:hypothetical protein
MNTIQAAIRNKAVNGAIKLDDILPVAKHYDDLQAENVRLLKLFKQNTGVIIGEQIDEHLAKVEGKFFNAREWDMKETNGEQ